MIVKAGGRAGRNAAPVRKVLSSSVGSQFLIAGEGRDIGVTKHLPRIFRTGCSQFPLSEGSDEGARLCAYFGAREVVTAKSAVTCCASFFGDRGRRTEAAFRRRGQWQ
jgi:hypothetical protein